MKKCILFLMAIAFLQTYAADYTYKYLVFTSSNGEETLLATDGLKLKVSADGNLVAENNSGTSQFALSSLKKMEFSADGVTTPIDQAVNSVSGSASVQVYNLSGVYQGTFSSMSAARSSLGSGIYLTKQNGKNTKMMIK